MAVLANQAKVIIASKKSSIRTTISLPGTRPNMISGERSIDKIRMNSPASVLIKVTKKIATPKTRIKDIL